MVFNVFVLSLPTKLHSSKRQPPYYGLFSLMYAGICGNLIRAFSHSFYCFKLLFHSEAAVEKEEQNLACMRKNFWECKSVLRTDLLRTKTPVGTILPYPKKVITNGCFLFNFIQVQIFYPKSDACKWWLWLFCFYLITHMASDNDLREYEQKIQLLENHRSASTVSDTICVDPAVFSTH